MMKKKKDTDDISIEGAFEGFLKDTFLAVFQLKPEKGQSRRDFIKGRMLAALIIIVIFGLAFLFEYD
ncbi:MAG: hypothetical protein EOM80_18325 [Erysipelotrichia bacterium]|nr:hypothetical protein [Erysipelotrichia bacterium]